MPKPNHFFREYFKHEEGFLMWEDFCPRCAPLDDPLVELTKENLNEPDETHYSTECCLCGEVIIQASPVAYSGFVLYPNWNERSS